MMMGLTLIELQWVANAAVVVPKRINLNHNTLATESEGKLKTDGRVSRRLLEAANVPSSKVHDPFMHGKNDCTLLCLYGFWGDISNTNHHNDR